jgi:hypothetical protein
VSVMHPARYMLQGAGLILLYCLGAWGLLVSPLCAQQQQLHLLLLLG